MTANYLIGLDIGGSGGRCLLINSETGESTIAYGPWKHPRAAQAGGWAYDMDTAAIWRALGQTVKEALRRAGISAAGCGWHRRGRVPLWHGLDRPAGQSALGDAQYRRTRLQFRHGPGDGKGR